MNVHYAIPKLRKYTRIELKVIPTSTLKLLLAQRILAMTEYDGALFRIESSVARVEIAVQATQLKMLIKSREASLRC